MCYSFTSLVFEIQHRFCITVGAFLSNVKGVAKYYSFSLLILVFYPKSSPHCGPLRLQWPYKISMFPEFHQHKKKNKNQSEC